MKTPKIQSSKKYYNDTSSIPDKHLIVFHLAGMLRQVDSSGFVEGGWVSSDVWFDRVTSYIKLKKWLKAHSTFIL